MERFYYGIDVPDDMSDSYVNIAIRVDKKLLDPRYESRRFLIVVGRLDKEDFSSRVVLSRGSPSSAWVNAAINLGLEYANGRMPQDQPPTAILNYQVFLPWEVKSNIFAANRVQNKRVLNFVKRYGITDVLILGDDAAASLLADVFPDDFDAELFAKTRGVPRKDKDGVMWTHTLSLHGAYSKGVVGEDGDGTDEDDLSIGVANMLGFVGRCAGNALSGGLVYAPRQRMKPNPVVVDTKGGVDALFDLLMDSNIVAVDTETTGLQRISNTLLTIQFATSPTDGYVLPLHHEKSPFAKNPSALSYIRKRLRQFFGRKQQPLDPDLSRFTVWQNAKFDITVIRQYLQLHHMPWRIWDVMGAEYCLDENLKYLKDFRFGYCNASAYTLDAICARYGIDYYLGAEFSKHNRGDISRRDLLKDEGVLNYAAMDVQVLMELQHLQQERADDFMLDGKSYGEDFKKLLLLQLSPIIYVESIMEHNGDHIDVPYLMSLLDPSSEFQRKKAAVERTMYEFPSVQNVNSRLLEDAQQGTVDLFGDAPMLFSSSRPAHKHALFFEELGLEPISFGKSGAPAVDKAFQDKYKDVPEVAVFNRLSKAKAIENNYIRAFYHRAATDDDMRIDHCLRASYGYTGTVTGRSNSYDPNLQNIVSRGEFAPYVKRAFCAPEGSLILKADYSAHEVRMLGITAKDSLLCSMFVLGRWFAKQHYLTGHPAYKKWKKTIGDVHKQNVAWFYGTTPEKATEQQRDWIKAVVFGTIYGRGAKAIANQLKANEDDIKKLIADFFKRFSASDAWLKSTKEKSVKAGYSYSPVKRIRHLYAQMFNIDSFKAAVERRGCNAPIQSIAADIGHVAAYLYHIHMLRVCRVWGLDDRRLLGAKVCSFVHDAIKTVVPHEYAYIAARVFNWCLTTGAMQYYKNHFGINFDVELEIEIEVAAHDAKHWKWDWHDGSNGDDSSGGLVYVLRKAVEDYASVYPSTNVEEMHRRTIAVTQNDELCAWLEKEYPMFDDWPDAAKVKPYVAKEYMEKAKHYVA